MKTIKYGLLVEGLVHYNTYYNGAPNEKKKVFLSKVSESLWAWGSCFFCSMIYCCFHYIFIFISYNERNCRPLINFFPSKFYINLCLH